MTKDLAIPKEAFSHPLHILPEDIDELDHVNNVVYVKWVQETALAHWHQVADELFRSQFAWVLLRHEIDYRQPAFLGDPVAGYTWVGKSEGPKFERFVALVNAETGKILAQSKTLWCLLDAQTLRPRRIESELIDRLSRNPGKPGN